ncbi:MAG: thioredoxin domain-containing protein, partial [Gammaproteobacteria bacterium]|nr:thioredoxin domain-containing protein [Gammaproteobacteria bacterium]
RHGGLGQAPKFPHVGALERLLRHWAATRLISEEDHQALHIVQFTLKKMSEGGLFDHLGGGFCRYSVDDQWMIPHFEKMLYDNGPLLGLLSELHAATGDELYSRTARKLAGWVMREMQSPAGGYYCALDADSEGEEGRFYYWEPENVAMIIGAQTYPLFAARYGLDRQPNFEGKWHLHSYTSIEELSQTFSLSEHDILQQIEYAEKRLFEEREQRTRPGLDDKILTSWNALMIKGMLQAARHLQEPDFAESALRALDFIQTKMWVDGRLKAACKEECVHLNAYLDDYAFMIDALVESLQWQWNPGHLQFARDLADTLLGHFHSEQGGFYFTSDDHEQLIERPRSFGDEAMPSGNAIAARALLRLGYLLGDTGYLDAAESTLRAGAQLMQQAPGGHACLANALEEQLYPPTLLVVRGDQESMIPLKKELDRRYSPRLLLFAIPDNDSELPEGLAEKKPLGKITAYVCEGLSCRPPVTDTAELSAFIQEHSIGGH